MGAEQALVKDSVALALEEFRRLGRTRFLSKYGFGKAKTYFVREPVSGTLCDSKAIAGAAYGHQFPASGPLKPEDFFGGEDTVAARLRHLGFEVVVTGEDWTVDEVQVIVRDYFEMLGLEVGGQPYNKSARNRALRETLRTRSKGSIERKHQNISSVLRELELRFIEGYKPLENTQSLLDEAVRTHIESNAVALARVFANFDEPPQLTSTAWDFSSAETTAPSNWGGEAITARARIPRKLDFAGRDERNRSLGRRGEEWVTNFERHRLAEAGRDDLAAAVEWVADTQGDGAGFDILSKELNGTDRFIEVKTTNGGQLTPFVLTDCELACSRELGPSFQIYRVFNFVAQPRFFTIPGPLDANLSLQPCEYRARFRRG